MIMSRFVPLIIICLACIPKLTPITAQIENRMEGPGRVSLEQTSAYMEAESKGPFLHSEDPDIFITIEYGDLEPAILGEAMPVPGRCKIIISNDLDPLSPMYDRRSDLPLVLIHEIGHCFGLLHVSDPNAVMYYAENDGERSPHSIAEYFRSLNEIRGVK